jgi:hypothetical protein
MGLFDIDYDSVVWQNLPVLLRGMAMYGWLKSLAAPVVYLDGEFTTNRNNNLYRLAHNGQVCFLTAALNDVFDPVERRIYITDGPYELPLYVYLVAEDQPLPLGLVSEEGSAAYPDPAALYLESETAALVCQFIVHVPSVIAVAPYSEAWLRSTVDIYRLPGKGYYQVSYF